MLDPLDADELRRCAKHCAEKAEQIVAARAERERLKKMSEAYLALAENADWLSGRSRDVALQNAAE